MDNTTYMDVKMVSDYLHVSKSTIYKWVEGNYIPHKKLIKRVLFVKNNIDQWIEAEGRITADLPDIPKFKS